MIIIDLIILYFSAIYKRKDSTPPDGLIRAMRYSKVLRVHSLNYGRRMEPRALSAYRAHHSSICQTDVQVYAKGLKVNTEYPYLGSSIDGYVKCSKCGEGIVEVKCPYGKKNDRWRNLTPEECCKNKDFCCTWNASEETIELKENHNYYFQVQGQLGIYKKQWVDFFVWTKKGSSTQRIRFNQTLWKQLVKKLKHFYVNGLVPELYTMRVSRGKPLYG